MSGCVDIDTIPGTAFELLYFAFSKFLIIFAEMRWFRNGTTSHG